MMTSQKLWYEQETDALAVEAEEWESDDVSFLQYKKQANQSIRKWKALALENIRASLPLHDEDGSSVMVVAVEEKPLTVEFDEVGPRTFRTVSTQTTQFEDQQKEKQEQNQNQTQCSFAPKSSSHLWTMEERLHTTQIALSVARTRLLKLERLTRTRRDKKMQKTITNQTTPRKKEMKKKRTRQKTRQMPVSSRRLVHPNVFEIPLQEELASFLVPVPTLFPSILPSPSLSLVSVPLLEQEQKKIADTRVKAVEIERETKDQQELVPVGGRRFSQSCEALALALAEASDVWIPCRFGVYAEWDMPDSKPCTVQKTKRLWTVLDQEIRLFLNDLSVLARLNLRVLNSSKSTKEKKKPR